MKKILIALLSMVIGMIVGCDISENEMIKMNEESIISFKEGENLVSNYANTVSIQIQDVCKKIYDSELMVSVDSNYIQEFIEIGSKIELDTEIVMRTVLYRICLFDKNGCVIDTWDVDVYRSIQISEGNLFKRKGQIDELLTKIEEKYNLGYELLERIPGELYYKSLTNASSAYFRKQTENNFDNYINFPISNEEIKELSENWNKIDVSKEKITNYTLIYTINIYNKEENSVGTFHIDDENKIYTNYGYELKGEFICNWVYSIKKSALNI